MSRGRRPAFICASVSVVLVTLIPPPLLSETRNALCMVARLQRRYDTMTSQRRAFFGKIPSRHLIGSGLALAHAALLAGWA